MLRKVETSARVKQSREPGQQGDLGEHHQINMALQEIGNHVCVVSWNYPKSGDRKHSRRRSNNDKKKPERPEIPLSATPDVIESHSARSYEQHPHQRNRAAVHMKYCVNQIMGNLMQRQPLGN